MTDTTSTAYRYWAFVSYSHQDNLTVRGDGSAGHIKWANWLHEQLETFLVPQDYRDHTTATGERMPQRFYPAFRDEAELPTSHDLAGQIRDALLHSRFLIVIASRRSASSHYVNEEVRYFRELGRDNRILTLIIDGEPNVRLTPKSGWTVRDECFCPALVHPVGPNGNLDTARFLAQEPIAADVRVKDEDPPREMLAYECRRQARRELLDYMKLKIVAGLMGVGFDELYQRDKRRQLEAARRRAHALRRWLIAVSVLAIFAVIGGILAWQQKQEALAQNTARKRLLQDASRSEHAVAENLFRNGNWEEAVNHLARSLTYNPDNKAAAAHFWSAAVHASDKIMPRLILRLDYAAREHTSDSIQQTADMTGHGIQQEDGDTQ